MLFMRKRRQNIDMSSAKLHLEPGRCFKSKPATCERLLFDLNLAVYMPLYTTSLGLLPLQGDGKSSSSDKKVQEFRDINQGPLD